MPTPTASAGNGRKAASARAGATPLSLFGVVPAASSRTGAPRFSSSLAPAAAKSGRQSAPSASVASASARAVSLTGVVPAASRTHTLRPSSATTATESASLASPSPSPAGAVPPPNTNRAVSRALTGVVPATRSTGAAVATPAPAVNRKAYRRLSSALNIPRCDRSAELPSASDSQIRAHCDIEYHEDECAITSERLRRARESLACGDNEKICRLTAAETDALRREQKTIRETIFSAAPSTGDARSPSEDASATATIGGVAPTGTGNFASIKDQMRRALQEMDEDESLESETVEEEGGDEEDDSPSAPQDPTPVLRSSAGTGRHGPPVCTAKAQLMVAKIRARIDRNNDGVLGVQKDPKAMARMQNSILGSDKFMMYNLLRMDSRADVVGNDGEEKKEIDVEYLSHVRKPNLSRIISEYEAMRDHPKYNLKQVVLSRRFHLYAHRFANAQYQRTLVYPTLRQPREMFPDPAACPWLSSMKICGDCAEEDPITEKRQTRRGGHRFVIAADTQFGILMDGFAMEFPNWSQEIEISRRCVSQINAMQGRDRPLFVCVCGDLVDTESSFSGAIASWKKVMSGWERNLVFEQQVKDFKRVWSGLAPDIALVCLCGNHDVGNRPTRASIRHWTSSFGDDRLGFWANGSFNLCLNNCLFSNPEGALDMFQEQLRWMEDALRYARENDATHIFVYGHFPWFLRHEDEADDFLKSYSAAPAGWGPSGSSFADSYFTIPLKQRKLAMALFKKYDVTACFSGHFHQNVVAQTSWGMPMIVTGPLSMNLTSEIAHELSNGETNGIGMRVVDVGGERGEFTHRWTLLNDEVELYGQAVERCIRQSMAAADGRGGERENSWNLLLGDL